jgi:hypothetical protein
MIEHPFQMFNHQDKGKCFTGRSISLPHLCFMRNTIVGESSRRRLLPDTARSGGRRPTPYHDTGVGL